MKRGVGVGVVVVVVGGHMVWYVELEQPGLMPAPVDGCDTCWTCRMV